MANGTMANPNMLGVRDALTNKYGIANERIGWDGEYVTIDGQRAIKPTQIADNQSYASGTDIQSAVQPFLQQANVVQRPMGQISETAAFTNVPSQQTVLDQLSEIRSQLPQYTNPYDQQFNDLFAQLSGRITNPEEIDIRDVYRSPMYRAQEEQAQRQAQQAIRSAQEALGNAGFGRSTRLTDRAQSIQNQANEYLMTQVAPMVMQQMQAEQDRQTAALMDLIGVLSGERALQDRRLQNEFNWAMELLGFQTGREDRAEDIRWRDDMFAYQQARDAIADERWKTEFDEDVRRYGLDYALQQAIRQDRLNEAAADRALRSRGLDLEERALALREQETANQSNADLEAERRGLVDAIRSGQITPGQALQQIEEDLALGFYTPEQAAILLRDLQTIAPNLPTPTPTPSEAQAQEEFRRSLPSDAELEAEARRLGYPILDYRSYAKDPKGMMAGLTFEQWRQLYGPRMTGR